MNEGLVLLAGWAQWLVLVGLLIVTVVRRVDHVHTGDRSLTYDRDRPSDDGDPTDR